MNGWKDKSDSSYGKFLFDYFAFLQDYGGNHTDLNCLSSMGSSSSFIHLSLSETPEKLERLILRGGNSQHQGHSARFLSPSNFSFFF
jgi:hypothetical protein